MDLAVDVYVHSDWELDFNRLLGFNMDLDWELDQVVDISWVCYRAALEMWIGLRIRIPMSIHVWMWFRIGFGICLWM